MHKALENILSRPKTGAGEKSFRTHPDLLAFSKRLRVTTPSSQDMYRQQKTSYCPELAAVCPAISDHWCYRAKSLHHPVLKARYADLAWECRKGERILEMANIAIDEYIRSCTPQYRRICSNWYGAASRALNLAFQIKDCGKAQAALERLLELQRLANDDHSFILRIFNRIMGDSRIVLDQELLHQQMHLLETCIAEAKNVHTLEAAYSSLTIHSTRIGKNYSIDKLRRHLAKRLEKFTIEQDSLTAVWYYWPMVMELYKVLRDWDGHNRARIHFEKMTAQAQMEMPEIAIHCLVDNDIIEKEIEALISDEMDTTLEMIAGHFVRPYTFFVRELQNVGEFAPLESCTTRKHMKGRQVVATIGAADDAEGRILDLAREYYIIGDGLFLSRAVQEAIENHNVEPCDFEKCANRHQLYLDTKLLLEGIEAWYERDYVKAIHVLVPQIEFGLRAIAASFELPATRERPTVPGASTVIPMGTILSNKIVQRKLGDDMILYFKSIYTDPRGYNLRNQFAHGLLKKDEFSEHLATRVIHTLLVLGYWKELANEDNCS